MKKPIGGLKARICELEIYNPGTGNVLISTAWIKPSSQAIKKSRTPYMASIAVQTTFRLESGVVTAQSSFLRFTGKYYHCFILCNGSAGSLEGRCFRRAAAL